MWQGFGIYCLTLIVCLVSVQASVIRQETTTPGSTMHEEPQESSTTVEPEINTESTKTEWASVDPAPGTLPGDHSVSQDKPLEKSAKLLLLSTPAKRPAQVELQLEEEDENETAAAGSAEVNVTTEAAPAAATTTEYSTETPEATTDQSSDHKTTKLFAINATTSTQDEATLPNVAIAVATDNATISIAEQPQAAGDNNVAIELALVEPEAEYVLHDSELLLDGDVDGPLQRELLLGAVSHATHDDLQLGSFTHIGSDVHLQPVVHSVEIVPTRLDDPLIVNYVHNLR